MRAPRVDDGILQLSAPALIIDANDHILVAGCLWVVGGLWIRTLGVDLTPESAIVRGVRRRSVSWPEVQAVVRVKGGWCVQLILESGEAVTLRPPTLSVWGSGGAEFEGDFHRCLLYTSPSPRDGL